MDIKKQIQQWFDGPQDYNEGMDLLREVTKKSRVIGKLLRGDSRHNRAKMVYLLAREIGLKQIPAAKAKSNKKTPRNKKTDKPQKVEKLKTGFEGRTNLIGVDEKIDDYPEEIRKLVNQYSDLYKQRGINHKSLKEIGNSNDKKSVSSRKDLIKKIDEQSKEMEKLFIDFTKYKETGSLSGNDDNAQGSMKDTGTESIEYLKKMKKNLQASLAKDRNTLKYQSLTKPDDGKMNPLPEGPKRIRLEKRVKTKEAEINDLDIRIAKLE